MSASSDIVAELRDKLARAIQEAKTAGLAASQQFVERQEIAPDGHLGDTCGWAFVEVTRPSYHFREALKQLKPRSFGFKAKWTVLGFGREIGIAASQSLTAHEIACKAACVVLQQHFPTEHFIVDSHMD